MVEGEPGRPARRRARGVKAGRELDAIVAGKVMGCTVANDESGWPHCRCKPRTHETLFLGIPRYSTHIAAAWQVVETMCERDQRPDLVHNGDAWIVSVTGPKGDGAEGLLSSMYVYRAKADTAPLAICLAALKAVGVEVPE